MQIKTISGKCEIVASRDSKSPNVKEEILFDGGEHHLVDAHVYCRTNRLIMRNGAMLCIGSSCLEIDAEHFEFQDACILAFEPAEKSQPAGQCASAPGGAGGDGADGLSAGQVLLSAKRIINLGQKPMLIDVTGQKGGDGGNGANGDKGLSGSPGKPGALIRYKEINGNVWVTECGTSPTAGETGHAGGLGGDGGSGGKGGNGGLIRLHVPRNDVKEFSLAAGKGLPGQAGAAGDGGPGGDGGTGGRGPSICGNAPDGASGPKGMHGCAKGTRGAGGDGSILIIP